MRIIRYLAQEGDIRHAAEQPGGRCFDIDGDIFHDFEVTNRESNMVKLLAPVEPPIILCIGLNYRKHAAETGAKIPEYPVLFIKSPGTLQHPGDPIVLPTRLRSTEVDYECELAVVIGQKCKNVSKKDALDVVFGYTAGNDVSARDWQKAFGGGQWCRGKGFDTFAPLGPAIVTKDEIPNPNSLRIGTRVNSKTRQSSNTSDMIFDVPTLIEFLSGSTTLYPGTVILTGTPEGVGMAMDPPQFLARGDFVEVEIEKIGLQMSFQLSSQFQPRGDQQQAIDLLIQSLEAGNRHQTLLGVTGSGKTFTAANVVATLNKPTLVISHNKTLAAQLYSEFKQFFPENAVEYFVSYFDYYQPEAYIPRTDTYIEKDSSINEEIERLRLSATSSLLSREDVIVVSSVSCIYGLGSPEDYANMVCAVAKGQQMSRELLLAKLVDMLYERNDIALTRGRFRARGDVVEVHPATFDEEAIRIEFFGDEIDLIARFDPLTGQTLEKLDRFIFYPAKQFVTPHDKMQRALRAIREELDDRVKWFEAHAQFLEAQRIKMRTEFDLEMMQEMGFCSGIENYSRHLSGRPAGSRPYTLLDFFPKDFLLVVDESHATIPQIGGMYEGDRSRKTVLVDYGFRLPSALDNRPLNFPEFMEMVHQILYISATPAAFEIQNSVVGNSLYIPHSRSRIGQPETEPVLVPMLTGRSVPTFDVHTPGTQLIAQQIIRPTGLLDPKITVRPLKHQIDETIEFCRQRTESKERVLITTLTKRTAEDLTDYLRDVGLKVRYLHSEIDAIERVEILRSLRSGEFDILVGINLLREGLDLPEVSLVCILDADKEGFLRSQTSLIQTAGRAARHVNGEVILFADTYTDSIEKLIAITEFRRSKQIAYNEANGITPTSVSRAVQESLHSLLRGRELEESVIREGGGDFNVTEVLRELEAEMQIAAANLEYERAALLRDQIMELKNGTGLTKIEPKRRPVKYGGGKSSRAAKGRKR